MDAHRLSVWILISSQGTSLWVIVAELPGPPVQVVIVSLTTKRADSDTTVVLRSGDHPFIKHDTIISYSDARQISKNDLIDRIERKFFGISEIFAEDKLKIIQRGLLISPHTPKEIKSLCRVAFKEMSSSEESATDNTLN